MGLLERLSAWVSGGAPATVLVLGLDGSGKTSLLAALRAPASPAAAAGAAGAADAAESAAPTAPTVGHTQEHFQCGGVSFRAWDAPGAARLRALWERHYRRADAIIFVVDSSDHLRLVVAREELELVLAHPDVRARRPPLLVLANKSDAPHALPAPRVAAALGLERVTEAAWHVGACSARGGAGLRDALTWLARRLRDRPR